ncbi:unnamed protein product [Onchocerca flexuosa]|uniref:Uncharacterized protein n=1 Tax=Onchocerca flexuosa TaxID=387005 RepID=A0A183H4Y0_9BILA|nr:unnamed protein product [Onchocerca flexuosa]
MLQSSPEVVSSASYPSSCVSSFFGRAKQINSKFTIVPIISLYFIAAFELDEVLLSSEQELMPMNDLQCSDEEASSSSAFSTIITANLGPSARISTELFGVNADHLIFCQIRDAVCVDEDVK